MIERKIRKRKGKSKKSKKIKEERKKKEEKLIKTIIKKNGKSETFQKLRYKSERNNYKSKN